ncbi:MAG: hypothetical protein JO048_16055 [Methylobacteriaceae bacterium]|nr:hypothetical protein [Methylobacteriaceae bacterium]
MRRRVLGLIGAVALLGLAAPDVRAQSLFTQPVAPDPAPAAAAPAAAPEAAPAKPKPRRVARPKGPVPARAVVVANASPGVLTGLEIAGEGKSATLRKPLAPNARTTLKLPALRTCTVSVTPSFEGAPGETSEVDICREKTLRFVN